MARRTVDSDCFAAKPRAREGLVWGACVAIGCLCLPAAVCGDEALREQAKTLFGQLEPPAPQRDDPRVALGRRLFWDRRISAQGKTSCAACHLPEDGGADRRRFSVRDGGRLTSRNSQTVFNATLQPALRWIGDRKSAADQAVGSLTGSMGHASPAAAVERLRQLGYEPAFRRAFPRAEPPLSAATFGEAIAAYEATLVTPAPFDRFLAGDDDALAPVQKQGLQLFIELGCADCHHGPLLGGESLEKFGVVKDYWLATRSEAPDEGLFLATQQPADRSRFRVSMLRNIAETSPYFHDGSVAALHDAVAVMADVQLGVILDEEQRRALVAFLQSLSGAVPKNYGPPEVAAAGADAS